MADAIPPPPHAHPSHTWRVVLAPEGHTYMRQCEVCGTPDTASKQILGRDCAESAALREYHGFRLSKEGPLRGVIQLDPGDHQNCPSHACAKSIFRARLALYRGAKALGIEVGTSVDPAHTYVMAVYPYVKRTLRRRGTLPSGHGTRSRYERGCHCEKCRAANREYKQAWTKAHKRERQ